MFRFPFLQTGLIALSTLALFAAHPAHAQLSFRLETFDVPGQTPFVGSLAQGISASGNIAGTYVDSVNFIEHGYIRNANGNFTFIDYPGAAGQTGINTRVITGGINSAGFVAGDAFDANFNYITDFIYNSNNGTFIIPHAQDAMGHTVEETGLQNVNEAGIVGVQYGSFSDTGLHSAGYNIATGTFTYYNDIAGYDNHLQAVGPNGELLISLAPLNGAAGGSHGLVIRNGVQTQVDFPGAYSTVADEITTTGLIVGNYRPQPPTQQQLQNPNDPQNRNAYVYDTLNNNWYSIMVPGAVETGLYHGNNDTHFVGYYRNADGVYHSLIVTAVPEPGSIALLTGMALSGGLFLRRRARTRRAS